MSGYVGEYGDEEGGESGDDQEECIAERKQSHYSASTPDLEGNNDGDNASLVAGEG